jgi:hypothetical protein
MQSTMAWRFQGRLVVVVHSQASPSNGEWQRFLNDCTHAGVDGGFRLFVVSYGGGPDGEQRRAVAEIVKKSTPPPVAMLTNSKLVRALMFAFSFINRSTKVLALEDSDAAFDFLGLDGKERDTARRLRRELEIELALTPKASGGVSASPRG